MIVVVPPVEAVGGDDDPLPSVDDSVDAVAPTPRHLDRGFHRLRAGVHRQHRILVAQGRESLAERSEAIVVKGSAGERHSRELTVCCRDRRGVPVSEVQRGVAPKTVQVTASFDVGDPGSLRVGDHNEQRVVIVRGELVRQLEVLGGRERHGEGSAGRSSVPRAWNASGESAQAAQRA